VGFFILLEQRLFSSRNFQTNGSNMSTKSILQEIEQERNKQDTKWGEQNHPFHHPLCAIEAADKKEMDAIVAAFYNIPSQQEVKQFCDSHIPLNQTNFATILLEEVVEALSECDDAAIRAELIQVAAVAVNAIEAIDRRTVRPRP
jgi:hypothetical protein